MALHRGHHLTTTRALWLDLLTLYVVGRSVVCGCAKLSVKFVKVKLNFLCVRVSGRERGASSAPAPAHNRTGAGDRLIRQK